MNTFLILLDAALIGLGAYYLFWQSKIDVRGAYSTFQLVMAVFFGFWFVSTGVGNMYYVVFMAAFLTLTVMTGSTGLTPTRLINVGLFSRVIPYTRLVGVTLTPLQLPNGQSMVVAVFGLSARRFVRLTFRSDLQSLIQVLRPRVPQNVEIRVQQVQ